MIIGECDGEGRNEVGCAEGTKSDWPLDDGRNNSDEYERSGGRCGSLRSWR